MEKVESFEFCGKLKHCFLNDEISDLCFVLRTKKIYLRLSSNKAAYNKEKRLAFTAQKD